MSISVKLSDIRTAISSAYSAVSAKGGTLPAQQTLNALPTAIQGIPSGGGTDSRFKDLVERTITSAEDSTVTEIGVNAFFGCSSLATAVFPACTSIADSAFYECSILSTISFPECVYIGYEAFAFCNSLVVVRFPACTYITENAFVYCRNLEAIYIGTSDCILETPYAFYGTRLMDNVFTIYVPSDYVEDYKNATNWSDLAEFIYGY